MDIYPLTEERRSLAGEKEALSTWDSGVEATRRPSGLFLFYVAFALSATVMTVGLVELFNFIRHLFN